MSVLRVEGERVGMEREVTGWRGVAVRGGHDYGEGRTLR